MAIRTLTGVRCQAAFRVYAPAGSATDITALLGIEASTGMSDGGPWLLRTVSREPSELAEHLTELLDRLEPSRARIADLVAEGYRMDWFCFVEARDLEHAIELDLPLLRRLAGYPGPLLIDTYCGED